MADLSTIKYDVFNVSTGENEQITLTLDELAQREADAIAHKALIEAQLEAREQLRQSAISKLVAGQPLTTAEAELLVIR